MIPGDLVWLESDSYGNSMKLISGIVLSSAVSNVTWGDEPFSPELWNVLVEGEIRKIWENLLEVDKGE